MISYCINHILRLIIHAIHRLIRLNINNIVLLMYNNGNANLVDNNSFTTINPILLIG